MTQPPFQVFIDTHREDVYRFLVAAVGAHEADDCFQETFVAAMRAYPRLEPGSNLRAWVLTIANRKAIDLHRARARRPLPLDPVPERAVDAAPPELRTELWDQVRELPPRQRAAVLYRFAGDLPFKDVGEAIGCSEAAARQNVHEALTKLREVVAA